MKVSAEEIDNSNKRTNQTNTQGPASSETCLSSQHHIYIFGCRVGQSTNKTQSPIWPYYSGPIVGHDTLHDYLKQILRLEIAQAKLNAKVGRVSGGKLASLGCLGGSPAYDDHDVKAPSAGENVTFWCEVLCRFEFDALFFIVSGIICAIYTQYNQFLPVDQPGSKALKFCKLRDATYP